MSGQRAIVIGAGHNGLVAAALLARDGWQVEVFEARGGVGGLCAGEVFHPGYRHIGIHHDSAGVRPWVVEALQLSHHGLELRDRPRVLAATPAGGTPPAGVVLHADPDHTATDAGVSLEDAEGVRQLAAFVRSVAPVVERVMDDPAPALGNNASPWALLQQATAVRRLGAATMLELMRVGVLCVDDFLSEYIQSPRLKAAMAIPALLGTFMGPRSPHSAGMWLIRTALNGQEVVGGPARLAQVLHAVAVHHGAEVRTGTEVEQILVGRTGVRGVQVRGGALIEASVVVSAADPRRTLLDLVPPLQLPPLLEDEIRGHRVRATSAKVHLALSVPPTWTCRPDAWERIRVADTPLDIERAFDAAKHRRLPDAPSLDVRIPSMIDPGLAPAGHHVASIHAFGVPYEPRGGWSAAAREHLLERVVAQLETVAPGIAESIQAAEVLTPPEIEARYAVTGGHLMHGEHALDQLWGLRPGTTTSGHTTPIRGLFLASGGTHPGGGATGTPGALAARAVAEAQR